MGWFEMATEDRLLVALGLSDAPLVRLGVRETVLFFEIHVLHDPLQYLNYLRGIDFHKEVKMRDLNPGTLLSRHLPSKGRPKPFVYFTQPGTSPFSTGTSFPETQFELFRTPKPMVALVSYASGLRFEIENVVADRLGGGTQYMLAATDVPLLTRVYAGEFTRR